MDGCQHRAAPTGQVPQQVDEVQRCGGVEARGGLVQPEECVRMCMSNMCSCVRRVESCSSSLSCVQVFVCV